MTTTPLHTIKIATNARNIGMMQGQIGTRAPTNSPVFTGDPKAPTPAPGDNDTSVATTAFVQAAVAAGGGITQLTGDATAGPGSGSQALTLRTVNSNLGTWNNVTINAKGLATAGSNVAYLTGNQTITLSGDISGSGTTAITTTLPTVNSNVGTFQGITVNAKGLVTAAVNQSYAPLASPSFTGVVASTGSAAGFQFNERTTTTAQWLLYADTGSVFLFQSGNLFTFANSGNLTIFGATATKASGTTWANPSSREIKQNIRPYDKGLQAVLALNPVTYSFNEESGFATEGTHIGLVHDETSHMPEMHTKAVIAGDREVDALDCSALTFALINAVKELTARVAELEKKA